MMVIYIYVLYPFQFYSLLTILKCYLKNHLSLVCAHTQNIYVEIRVQFMGPHGAQGGKSVPQTRWQVPLPQSLLTCRPRLTILQATQR